MKLSDLKVEKANWVKLDMCYNCIVIPMKDAVVIIAALENALSFKEKYGDKPEICEFQADANIRFEIMADKQVQQARLNYILQVNKGAE